MHDWALISAAAFAAGLMMTGWLRRYALQRNLLDLPNARSSHDRPTPRGGGLAIALVILASVLALGLTGTADSEPLLTAVLPAAVLVAAIGWLDDHRRLSILWRAGSYLAATFWLVGFSGGLERLSLGAADLPLGLLALPFLAVGAAWLINLYNFMDGADGLAGLQAVTAGVAGALLLNAQGAGALAALALVTAAVSAGFLVWNRPPARIFMGDVGSCTLGFIFGALAILGEQTAGLPLLVWVILLGYFAWDATLTLFMRMLRGERWTQAHRSHAYQRLLQLGWGHGRLALAFLCYNLLISWPLAAWTYYNQAMLPAALATSFVLTAAIWGTVQLRYARQAGLD